MKIKVLYTYEHWITVEKTIDAENLEVEDGIVKNEDYLQKVIDENQPDDFANDFYKKNQYHVDKFLLNIRAETEDCFNIYDWGGYAEIVEEDMMKQKDTGNNGDLQMFFE